MDIREIWKIVRRWWWLILLPLLVAGGYSLITYRAPGPSYITALRFTAGQPQSPGGAPSFDPNYYRWLASEYIVSGLKDWVRTGAFAEAVSADLAAQGVSVPPAAVAGMIGSSDNARSILIVYLNGSDPDQLRQVAEAVTRVLQTQNAAAFPQLGGQNAVVTALDQPHVGEVSPPLRVQLDVPLRLAISLAVGAALALLAHFLDPFIRDASDLEKQGWRVIAEIPRGKE
jgi:capsular polysaccharide biosynthesis protein